MSVKEEENTGYPVSESLRDFPEFNREQDALNAAQQYRSDLAFDINAMIAEEKANKDCGTRNWVGMLIEYRQAHRVGSGQPGEGVDFHETTVGPPPHRFTCTVTIAEKPEPMGGNVSFIVKKNAKRYAAKIAVEWLIKNNHMPADGTATFPKPKSPPVQQAQRARTPSQRISLGNDLSATSPSGRASPPLTGPTYASMVPELCYRLGLNPPSYVFGQKIAGIALYDAHADFGPHPQIHGPVGQVYSIFGKKNAKEESAKLTVVFLQGIEENRRIKNDEENEENDGDGRSSSPSNESEEGEEEGMHTTV